MRSTYEKYLLKRFVELDQVSLSQLEKEHLRSFASVELPNLIINLVGIRNIELFNEKIFLNSDFEKVFLLPSIAMSQNLSSSGIRSKDLLNLQTKLIELFYIWVIFTIRDKDIDNELLSEEREVFEQIFKNAHEFIKDDVKNDLNNYEKKIIKNSNQQILNFHKYSLHLQNIYSPYGNFINKLLPSVPSPSFELALTNILVFQKLMDDISDWEDDLQTEHHTLITNILENYVPDGELKKLKIVYLMKVLPQYILDLKEYIAMIVVLIGNNEPLMKYFSDIIKPVAELESYLSEAYSKR